MVVENPFYSDVDGQIAEPFAQSPLSRLGVAAKYREAKPTEFLRSVANSGNDVAGFFCTRQPACDAEDSDSWGTARVSWCTLRCLFESLCVEDALRAQPSSICSFIFFKKLGGRLHHIRYGQIWTDRNEVCTP